MDYYDLDYAEHEVHDIPDYEMYMPTVVEIWTACVSPSLEQIFKYSLPFIFWITVFRITSQNFSSKISDTPPAYKHLSSIVCGLALSYYTLGIDFLYSLCFTSIEYVVMLAIPLFKGKAYGLILMIFCLAVLFIGEVFDTSVTTWHRMRGTQMIAAVKIISIGFDIDRKKIRDVPNFLEFWGYILCPGNVIMGPWCAFTDYMNIFNRSKFSLIGMCQVIVNAFIALSFLLASNCLIETYIPSLHSSWGAAYKGALSFRCSHYFICFLSHCTMLMAGLGATRSQKQSQMLGYSITKPWLIELPRSLVDVVVYWNLSMHYWLKTYVFMQLKPNGQFYAIILTYIVSSLLHGLNLQLAAVLLSLGFATYAEYEVRKKVAEIFDACVLASACTDCSHRYKSHNSFVITFNLGFRLLAMFHLAYLGILMDGFVEQPDITTSWKHIQERWGNLNYMSHCIILFTIGLSFVI